MELAFDKVSIREICESSSEAKRTLGPKVAEKLKRRLADLRAAASVHDLIAGHPREVHGPRYRRIRVDLADDYYLVLSANHPVIPRLESGKTDWSAVSRIKIMRIGNNHAQN